MTKTEQLNELFKEWRMAQEQESDSDWKITKGSSKNIEKNFFCSDGIIDESVYSKEPLKVLFLTNEPNIDEYNPSPISSRIESFNDYYDNQYDSWGGKMRERICSLYQVIIKDFSHPAYKYAKSFAFMNLNKRGGCNTIKKGNHIKKYCEIYSYYINKEIQIIDPDIIIWIGTNTYDKNIKTKYMNAKKINGKYYLEINGKTIPLIRMWHTSYTQIRKSVEPMSEFDNLIIGRQATHLKQMLEYYNLT